MNTQASVMQTLRRAFGNAFETALTKTAEKRCVRNLLAPDMNTATVHKKAA